MAPRVIYSRTFALPQPRFATRSFLIPVIMTVFLCSACTSTRVPSVSANMVGGGVLVGSSGPTLDYNGERVSTIKAGGIDQGILIAGSGNRAVWIPGGQNQGPQPGYTDARELKLKIRELAEQLIASVDASMYGGVAVPVSFVNMDNMDETSSFGRFLAEQLYYEFNQRGFPVREYKGRGNTIVQKSDQGEFYLSRQNKNISVGKGGLVVAGTYYSDSDSIFVNARIIRPSDGMVLRTGQLVLNNTGVTRRMLARSGKGGGKNGGAVASMGIRDLNAPVETKPANASPFDQGEDIH